MSKGNIIIGIAIVLIVGATVGILLYKNSIQKINMQLIIPTTFKKNPLLQKEEVKEYEGKVLAGKSSPYLEFNKKDYDKSLESGKIIFLNFYANWCPVCRQEVPVLKQGFDEFETDKIIGFRVNFKDTDTDINEVQMAKDFEIPYQHTKVILKNGKVILKDGNTWDIAMFRETMTKVIGDK